MIIVTRTLLAISILASVGCLLPANSPIKNVDEASSLPEPLPTRVGLAALKTKRISLDGFSLTLPDSLLEVPLKTIDSEASLYKDDEMTVAFEFSMYAPKLVNYGDIDFREFQETIDGEACKLVSLEFRDTSNHIEPKKKYSVMGRFEQSERVGNDLNVYVYFRSRENQPVAEEIIKSIKFANK